MIGNLMILGDSYSTLKGYIVREDGFYYFPEETTPHKEGMVMQLEQTWWHRFVTRTGANLVRNDSWSGSTISYTGYSGDCSTTSSFIYRYRTLRENGYFKDNRIDTLIVFGGTNDSWVPAPLGEDRGYSTEEDLYYALPAISCLMNEMRRDLPDTRVVFIANCDINEKIVERMREEGDRLGIEVVELHDVEKINSHPIPTGMEQICEQIASALKV
ncbi:MAG: hypothetical protein IKC61_00300 [Clostridia bacterium]|nr:hypothetical protein [Clostridia bacterium]